MDRNIRRLGGLFSVLLAALLVNLAWLQAFDNRRLTADPHNLRRLEEEYGIKRGSIYSSDGVLLAESLEGAGFYKFLRRYPQGALYSHVLGYDSPNLGRAGIEAQYNDYLLAKDEVLPFYQRLVRTRREGYDLTLTLKSGVQEAAAAALGGRTGAVVAINPRTGAVLAMYSQPDFDPNRLVDLSLVETQQAVKDPATGAASTVTVKQPACRVAMDDYAADPSSPLLNRAAQGLYPPGSSFKPVTAIAAIEGAGIPTGKTYDCPGTMIIGGTKVRNYGDNSFGTIDMVTAMVHSVNTYFAQLAAEIGGETLVDYAERGGMNQRPPLDLPDVARSSMPQAWQSDLAELASEGYGQGSLLLTPLQMCLYGCAVANGGSIMLPHLLQDARQEQNVVEKFESREWLRMMSPSTASAVLEMMIEVVEEGTGQQAAISGYTVAGKTGTAEVQGKPDHTWFVGIAPARNPQVVVAVVVENSGGSGGAVAAPIAKKVMEAALR